MPQDKNPRRLASDFINCVYFDLLFMASYFKENNLVKTNALALIETASHAFLRGYSG
jgi:hypothetical protein